jgi:hypothetical protein
MDQEVNTDPSLAPWRGEPDAPNVARVLTACHGIYGVNEGENDLGGSCYQVNEDCCRGL